MKYNPVTNTIERANGTPYLTLAPGIGAVEAFQIADTLLRAPEWEDEKETLEAKAAGLELELRATEEQSDDLRKERDIAEARVEKLEDDLEDSRLLADEQETELTQARLRNMTLVFAFIGFLVCGLYL